MPSWTRPRSGLRAHKPPTAPPHRTQEVVGSTGSRRLHRGLEPPDEEAAKAVVGNAWKSLNGITATEALDRVSEVVYDAP